MSEGCHAVAQRAKAGYIGRVRYGSASHDLSEIEKFLFYVYILESLNYSECYYEGVTEDLRHRLKQHNAGEVFHTSKYKPWKIKNYFAFDDKDKAYRFERYLKSGSGRTFAKRHF